MKRAGYNQRHRMLPDFIDLKRRIARDRQGHLRDAKREESLSSLIPAFRSHEGDRFTVVREDQSAHTKAYRTFEVELHLKAADLLAEGTRPIHEMLDKVSGHMDRQLSEVFQQTMTEATNEAGTVTHAGGRKFSAELYIEGVEKMEFRFDDDGNWLMPTMISHPSHKEVFEREMSRLDSDPVLHARLTKIVKEKREAWRAREARRTLVD